MSYSMLPGHNSIHILPNFVLLRKNPLHKLTQIGQLYSIRHIYYRTLPIYTKIRYIFYNLASNTPSD